MAAKDLRIDLRLLRYFIAVAEEGHLTRAAQRLGIQQPPLSQQIRLLENELGVTLFRRLPRGMELTESGQALLSEAHALVAQMVQMVEDVRLISQGRRGKIAVGFTESASLHALVPSVIRAFRASAPDVALTVVESSTPELVVALRQRQVDLAFIRSPGGRRQRFADHAGTGRGNGAGRAAQPPAGNGCAPQERGIGGIGR
ncbi:MAG: LysR family transcriptional regulator [Janthinobacterium lividum]